MKTRQARAELAALLDRLAEPETEYNRRGAVDFPVDPRRGQPLKEAQAIESLWCRYRRRAASGSRAKTRKGAARFLLAHGIGEDTAARIPDEERILNLARRCEISAMGWARTRRDRIITFLAGKPEPPEEEPMAILCHDMPSRIALRRAIRRAANAHRTCPVTVVGGKLRDCAPRRIGNPYYFRWRGKWKTAKGSYVPATQQVVVVGWNWVRRFLRKGEGE